MTKRKLNTEPTVHKAYLFALMNTTPLKGMKGMMVEKFVLSPEPAIVADFPHLHYVLVYMASGMDYPKAAMKIRNHAESLYEVSTYWRNVYRDLLEVSIKTKGQRPLRAAKKV